MKSNLKDLIIDNIDCPMYQFCKEIGVSRPTIDNIVNERKKYTPSLMTVKKICKYFNVDFKEYL